MQYFSLNSERTLYIPILLISKISLCITTISFDKSYEKIYFRDYDNVCVDF